MGDTQAKVERNISADRLEAKRFCIDLAENVHLHRRELRLEFSRDEWEEFCRDIRVMCAWVYRRHKRYRDGEYPSGEGAQHAQHTETIPARSAYFPDRFAFERLKNGRYHLHIRDQRLEFSEHEAAHLLAMLREASDSGDAGVIDRGTVMNAMTPRSVAITDLWVRVLNADGWWTEMPVSEAPAYRLLRDGDIWGYEAYQERIRRLHPNGRARDVDEFYSLRQRMANAIDITKRPSITIDHRNVVWDGQHRLAIIGCRLGLDVRLKIRGTHVVALAEGGVPT